MERYYFGTGKGLVAVVTCNSHMSAGKREAGLLMLVERETGGCEGRSVVALLAAIAPRSCRELSFVHVLVAIDALRKFDFEFCFFASRRMT